MKLCEPNCRCKSGGEEYLQHALDDGSYPQSECPDHPGPFDNGEYEASHLSLVSSNHGYFRVHCRGWEGFTEEKRAHLKNCSKLVNKAIDKYNDIRRKFINFLKNIIKVLSNNN